MSHAFTKAGSERLSPAHAGPFQLKTELSIPRFSTSSQPPQDTSNPARAMRLKFQSGWCLCFWVRIQADPGPKRERQAKTETEKVLKVMCLPSTVSVY